MIALAGGLRDLGVSTRIAAYSDFGDKVRAAGCDFVDLEVSQADWWESQNAQQSDWAKNPLRTLKALRAGGKADARATATRLADIVKPREGIVSGTLSVGTAAGVAALRGSQVVAVHLRAPAEPLLGGIRMPGGCRCQALSPVSCSDSSRSRRRAWPSLAWGSGRPWRRPL